MENEIRTENETGNEPKGGKGKRKIVIALSVGVAVVILAVVGILLFAGEWNEKDVYLNAITVNGDTITSIKKISYSEAKAYDIEDKNCVKVTYNNDEDDFQFMNISVLDEITSDLDDSIKVDNEVKSADVMFTLDSNDVLVETYISALQINLEDEDLCNQTYIYDNDYTDENLAVGALDAVYGRILDQKEYEKLREKYSTDKEIYPVIGDEATVNGFDPVAYIESGDYYKVIGRVNSEYVELTVPKTNCRIKINNLTTIATPEGLDLSSYDVKIELTQCDLRTYEKVIMGNDGMTYLYKDDSLVIYPTRLIIFVFEDDTIYNNLLSDYYSSYKGINNNEEFDNGTWLEDYYTARRLRLNDYKLINVSGKTYVFSNLSYDSNEYVKLSKGSYILVPLEEYFLRLTKYYGSNTELSDDDIETTVSWISQYDNDFFTDDSYSFYEQETIDGIQYSCYWINSHDNNIEVKTLSARFNTILTPVKVKS